MIFRRIIAVVLLLCLIGTAALAQDRQQKVFLKGQVQDFDPDDALLDFYVAPLTSSDSMLLKIGEKTMLIDLGTMHGGEKVWAMLQALQIERVDYVFNTHPHDDHICGLKTLEGHLEIGEFLTTFPTNFPCQNNLQQTMTNKLAKMNVPVTVIPNETEMDFAGAKLHFFYHPNKKATVNNQGSMLLIEYGDTRLLLTADVESNKVQEQLVDEYPQWLKADIMKYPHHGISKISMKFLEAVDPEMAFITTGYYNSKRAQHDLGVKNVPYTFSSWGVIHFQTNGEYWIADHELTEDSMLLPERFGTQF